MLDHLFCRVVTSGYFILKSSFVKFEASEVMHANKLVFSKARSPQLNFSGRIEACNFFNTDETGIFINRNFYKNCLLIKSFFAKSLTLVNIKHFFSFNAVSIFQDQRDSQLHSCFIYSYL